MRQYYPLKRDTVPAYLTSSQGDFPALFPAGAELHVSDLSDGNINLVFRVVEKGSGTSLVLKQALPYIRSIGESWPLTLERARFEAETLRIHGEHCPEFTAQLLRFDPEMSLLLMEDLSEMKILRSALCEDIFPAELGSNLARYLAQTLFHTSDFYLASKEKKELVRNFINPELCVITEELFFSDPYQDHERNNFLPDHRGLLQSFWRDEPLKAQVARLKQKFLTEAQALLHGDLHSGSIFVRESALKTIDHEFAFVGSMAFDVGSVLGNLLLHICSREARTLKIEQRREQQEFLLEQSLVCLSQFEERFLALCREKAVDTELGSSPFASQFVSSVLQDSLGFAGTEMIRRTIGLAHVLDFEGIEDSSARANAEAQCLELARALILQSAETYSVGRFVQLTRDVLGFEAELGNVAGM